MRKTVPMSFGELWDEFLQTNPAASRRLAEARVAQVWEGIVGPAVASRTTSISVERGVMYVRISSSVARNEIFMRRGEIKASIEKLLGAKVVNDVIVK